MQHQIYPQNLSPVEFFHKTVLSTSSVNWYINQKVFHMIANDGSFNTESFKVPVHNTVERPNGTAVLAFAFPEETKW